MFGVFYSKNIGKLNAKKPPLIKMVKPYATPEEAAKEKLNLEYDPRLYHNVFIAPILPGEAFAFTIVLTADGDFRRFPEDVDNT